MNLKIYVNPKTLASIKMDLQNHLAEQRKSSKICKTHILNYFFYVLRPFFLPKARVDLN